MITFTRTTEEFVQKRLEQREQEVEAAFRRCEQDVARIRRGREILEEMAAVLPPEALEENQFFSVWGVEVANVRIKDTDEARAAVARAVKSRLEVAGKSLRDADAGTIIVWLRAARRPELKFHYVTTIKEGDPCRIHSETETRRTLVCEVPKP